MPNLGTRLHKKCQFISKINTLTSCFIFIISIFSPLAHPWLLHVPISIAGPSSEQSLPFRDGAGFVHERTRALDPPPHDLQQCDHSDHSVYPPLIIFLAEVRI